MFRIYFDSKICKETSGFIEVEAETLGEVEAIALIECRRRLHSRFIMLHHLSNLVYAVIDGFNVMGEIKIRSF